MKILLDANVLYPPTLRDLLFCLAKKDVLSLYWSEKIIEEWTYNVQRQLNAMQKKELQKVQIDMASKYSDSLVKGYEYLMDTIRLNAANDKHVAAAAVHAKVDVLLTFNTKDFPKSSLRKYGIVPTNPDRFLCDLMPMHHSNIVIAIDEMISMKRYTDSSRDTIVTSLHNRGLIKSMRMLKAIFDKTS